MRRGATWWAWIWAALAGCSSLPTFVPDLARRPGPPVQLEGARGPLTAAQSKPRIRSVGKAIQPGADEVANNPRARSAVLRVAEKLAQ